MQSHDLAVLGVVTKCPQVTVSEDCISRLECWFTEVYEESNSIPEGILTINLKLANYYVTYDPVIQTMRVKWKNTLNTTLNHLLSLTQMLLLKVTMCNNDVLSNFHLKIHLPWVKHLKMYHKLQILSQPTQGVVAKGKQWWTFKPVILSFT